MYQFDNLKKFIEEELKIDTSNAKGLFETVTERLTHADVKDNLDFDDEPGILYTNKKGQEKRGFLFIEIFDPTVWLERYGTDLPKFHVTNCSTIERQRQRRNFDGHYVFSNRPVTNVKNAKGEDCDIQLCGNCFKDVNYKITRGLSTTNFCNQYLSSPDYSSDLTERDMPEQSNKALFTRGYTPDWDSSSREYRESQKFTCENCSINLSNNFLDAYYLETHHVNLNKSDNSRDNLKCLCVLCHANMDEVHRKNYSVGNNFLKVQNFKAAFYKELKEINNPYL